MDIKEKYNPFKIKIITLRQVILRVARDPNTGEYMRSQALRCLVKYPKREEKSTRILALF